MPQAPPLGARHAPFPEPRLNHVIHLLDGPLGLSHRPDYFGQLGGDITPLHNPLTACIGPITTDTARSLRLRVGIHAAEYTIAGLVEVIKSWVAIK
jgi:hypothetical protein